MARTGLKLVVLLALVVCVIAPQHAAAQCIAGWGNGFNAASFLNNEGLKERPSDITITSHAGPYPPAYNCFSSGNTISVTYNGILTAPTTLVGGVNYVLYNPGSAIGGTLGVSVSTTYAYTASGPETVILVEVISATTDPLASITLQNLRFDVAGLAPSQAVPTVMNAFVSGSSTGLTGVSTVAVGQVLSTISTTALTAASISQGSGTQSSNGPLTTQAGFSFADAPGWHTSAFRTAIAAGNPIPANCTIVVLPCDLTDIATNATSLVIDVESIPNGVTVTFPPTISIPNVTAPTVQWKLRTTATSTGVAQAIYDTVLATVPVYDLVVVTGAVAADAQAGSAGPPVVPPTKVTIGVQIGPSSGNGTAQLRVVFGPGGNFPPPAAATGPAFTGDDFNTSAVPNYVPVISTSGVGREIITDTVINGVVLGVDTAPTNWFTIQPTQSAILFQYATDRDGYQTGLAVTNTGKDSIFKPTKGETGPVIWYLFANGVTTPIIYQTKATDGTGLDASGNLEPGNTLAITLDELLNASGNSSLVGTFSGYVIALGEFNYGHGYDIIVDSAGHFSSLNALFLGNAVRNDLPGGVLGGGLPQ